MTPKLAVGPIALLIGLNLYGSNSAISGDYIEARSGHVYTCGCLYSGEQATGGREAILAWSVREGEFRGTSLGGSKAVAVIRGASHLGLPNSARESALFVDAASPAARAAIVALLRERYGNVLGRILDVHSAPIAFDREGDRVTLSVGEVSRVVVRPARLPQDAHPGSALWYDPFIRLHGAVLATMEHSAFSGADFQHRWWTSEEGINGYIGTFTAE